MDLGVYDLARRVIVYIDSIIGAGYDMRTGLLDTERLKEPEAGGGIQWNTIIMLDDVSAIVPSHQQLAVHNGKPPYEAIAVLNEVETLLHPGQAVVRLNRDAVQTDTGAYE